MRQSPNPDSLSAYQVRVRGRLDPAWADAWEGMTVTYEDGVSTISGPVVDQAALRGMLCRLWDLNMTLLSVRCVEIGFRKEEEND